MSVFVRIQPWLKIMKHLAMHLSCIKLQHGFVININLFLSWYFFSNKKIHKATLMCKNLWFGVLLVEPSFEFMAVLHSCVHVRAIKTAARTSACRPSIPLPLMSEVTWSMCTQFSTFPNGGSFSTLWVSVRKVQLEYRPGHKLPWIRLFLLFLMTPEVG